MGRERAKEAKPKKDKQPHPFAEVPGRGGQQQIELIALEAFEEAAREPKVVFEMANDRFESRSTTKALSHRRAPGGRLPVRSSSVHDTHHEHEHSSNLPTTRPANRILIATSMSG